MAAHPAERSDARTRTAGRAREARLLGPLLQVVTLLPLAAAYLWFALAVRGAHSFSGDEPHYLALTQGLWLYHTIDQHNVLYHHDFFAYYPQLMSSHSVHRGGHLYPLHYPGLPLTLLPGFALGGAAGGQVTMAAIALLVCWRALRLASRMAGPLAAAVAVGVLGLSAPFVLNAGAIFPDLLSGLLLLLAYELVDAPVLTPRRALGLGMVLALCPWVHVKLLVVVAIFMAWAAALLWRQQPSPPGPRGMHVPPLHRERGRRIAALLALGLPLVSIAGLMLYNLALYGSASPAAAYNGPTLFTGNALTGLAGQIFTQGQGMLGTAPFALLALPGAVALWRHDRATALKIGVATLPFWLVTLTYRDWWGGDAPPLRYVLPLLPLWACGIAVLLAGLRTYTARLAVGLLAAVTLALTLVIPVAPRLGWPLSGGQGALLLALGSRLGLSLTAWLPAFEPTRTGSGVWHDAWLIAPWAALCALLWAYLAWRERGYDRIPLDRRESRV